MRTLNELEDRLAAEKAWRRTELHAMLSAIRDANGPTSDCLRRGGVALLYAHWEGFSKAALAAYWKFVARRALPYRELSLNFVALGIESELRRDAGKTETRLLVERVQRILSCDEDRARMTPRDVTAESNLNSTIFEDLMFRLGLDATLFRTKYKLIDYSLLGARNKVAHGEYLAIGVGDYANLHSEVLGLLDLVHNTVVNAASQKGYMRNIAEAS